MPVMTYREALRSAMADEMERDESVVILGEDIGVYGGTHLVTDGLLDRFGPKRVIDTPIAEGGFTGAAIGMAMMGMRPIVEMMTWNFSFQAVDQILQNAAKVRYFSAGQAGSERRRRATLSAAHPQPGRLLRSLPRPAGRFPGDAARRQGDDADRHPGAQPGHLPRGGRALRHQGRGAGG